MSTFDLTKADWRTSSFSQELNCVEVARAGGIIGVRDSKNPAEGTLVFTPAEWSAFTAGVRTGEFV